MPTTQGDFAQIRTWERMPSLMGSMAMAGVGVTKTRRPAAVTHLFPGENP
jgi:hypothetical protein